MTVSLDWLSITIHPNEIRVRDYVLDRLSSALGVEFKSAGGVHGYDSSFRADGVVLALGGESQKNTMLLSLSGAACGGLGWYGVAAFVRALVSRFAVRVKFTRIDLALDIAGEWWQNFDSPDRVFERLQDKRCKSVTIINNYERQEDPSGFTENWIVSGHTTYIGSRTSERFMRIYKKLKEDGTKVTRFEYELKGRYAACVGSMLLTGENSGTAYIFANSHHVDLTDIFDLRVLYEDPCTSLPRKKVTRTFQWLMTISGALVAFMQENQDMWETVIHEGRLRSPVGNTGVHFSIPEWVDEVHNQALNLDTFGVLYDPKQYYLNVKRLQ